MCVLRVSGKQFDVDGPLASERGVGELAREIAAGNGERGLRGANVNNR